MSFSDRWLSSIFPTTKAGQQTEALERAAMLEAVEAERQTLAAEIAELLEGEPVKPIAEAAKQLKAAEKRQAEMIASLKAHAFRTMKLRSALQSLQRTRDVQLRRLRARAAELADPRIDSAIRALEDRYDAVQRHDPSRIREEWEKGFGILEGRETLHVQSNAAEIESAIRQIRDGVRRLQKAKEDPGANVDGLLAELRGAGQDL